MIRNPSHAGTFYPRFAEQVKRQIEQWLVSAAPPSLNERSLGIILPHAGYMYSGQCAALGLDSVKHENIDSIIILHPCHSANHFDFSLSPYTEYENPLGILKLDRTLYDKLSPYADQGISLTYHQNEHSLEIQLPLISYFFPQATVLPIMIGNQIPAVSQRLAGLLLDTIYKSAQRILILCSTDLSHYHSAQLAEELDGEFISQLSTLAPEELWRSVRKGQCEACGIGGILTLMEIAKKYTNPRVKVIQYTHSGRVSGNNQQVVGYLAAKIYV